MSSSLLNKILSSTITSTPASNRACNNSNNKEDDDNVSSSGFQKTVCLYDWWLVKADKDFQGKRLAVAGFTSRELQAMRVFTSAPIVKRYDIFTLESADGICIFFKGFINKSRTLENGFSSEVFSHFMFGFPPCWEAYNEMCLGKEFTNATGSATFPDYSESALAPKCISNSIPTTSPSKHLESMSERITSNASRGPDSPNHTAECNNIDKTNNCTLENLPPSISCEANTICDINAISSIQNNLAVQAEASSYNATKSSDRVGNSKNSMEDNEGTMIKSTTTKEPACSESVITPNAAPEASPLPLNSVYNPSPSNLGPVVSRENSDVELMATSSGPKTLEEQKENYKNEDVLDCGIKNCSNVSSPQDCEGIVGCTGDKTNGVARSNLLSFDHEVRDKDSLSTPPSGGDTNVPDFSNQVGDGMTSPVVHPATDGSSVTSSKVDVNAVKISPSNSGSQKTSYCLRNRKGNQKENSGFRGSVKCKSKGMISEASEVLDGENLKRYDLRNLKSNQKEHSGFEGSVKCKRKEIMSEASQVLDGENLKKCSSKGVIRSGSKTDSLGATQSQSVIRIFRNLLDNLKGNKKERSSIICGLKAKRNEINSSSVNSDRTSNIVKNCTMERMNIFIFGKDDLHEPIHNTVMKDNSKQRRGYGKISLHETPRQKSNNLAQSPSGLGRANHRSNLKTVGENDRKVKEVGSTRRKTRRKINFDTHGSPLTQEREEKVSIISPDSLSLKRSRSGRLLLPSLEFWRNQVAVYDADRKITGIQEAADDVQLSKGSKSEPRKRKKRRFKA